MFSAFYVCCIYSGALQTRFFTETNNISPDQSVPNFTFCYGSVLFAI